MPNAFDIDAFDEEMFDTSAALSGVTFDAEAFDFDAFDAHETLWNRYAYYAEVWTVIPNETEEINRGP